MSKRKEESDHVDRKDVDAAAGNSRFAMDRSIDPVKKASAEIMAGRKIAGVRNRSSKSPQPAPFQNSQQGNTFGMQQMNGTSNNMSNGVSQSNAGFSFGSTSQSFPPSNPNNTGFGSSTQQSASFPAPQPGGIFSGVNGGGNNSVGFNFNAGAPSNPFANMSQNQQSQGFGQAPASNSSFQSSSNIFGRPQQSQQPSLFQQPNSGNPFQSPQNGQFGGQQGASPFQFGQTQSPSKTPEPAQSSAPQQSAPLFGGVSQTLSNPFANANTKQAGATATPSNLFAPTSSNSFGSPAVSNSEPPKDQGSGFSPFKNANQSSDQSTNKEASSGFKPSSFSTPSAPGSNKSFFSFGTPQANESPKPSSNLFQTPAADASSTAITNASNSSTPAQNRSPSPTKRFNPFANIKTTIEDPKASPDGSAKPDSSHDSSQETETPSAPSTSKTDVNRQSHTLNNSPFAQSSSRATTNLFQPSTPSKSSTTAEASNSFKPSDFSNTPQSSSTADSSNLFKPSQSSNAAPSSNVFQSSSSSQQQQMTPSTPLNLFQPSSTPSQPARTPQSSNVFQSSTNASATPTISKETPQLLAGQKEAYDQYASLRSFNRSFITALQQMDQTADFSPLFDAYRSELQKIQRSLPSGGKRKADDDDLVRTSPKKSRSNEVPSTTPTQSPSKSQASSIIDDVLGGQSMSSQKSPFKATATNAQTSMPASSEFTPKPATGAAPPIGFFPNASESSSSGNKAPSGFMPNMSQSTTQTTEAPTGFIPKGSGGTSNTNFFAQFGQRAAQTEEESKKRKKAEEFDSDEDDEAEWERKYEEEQRAKKRKIEEDAKQHKAEFSNTTGFSFKKVEPSKPAEDNEMSKQPSTSKPAEVDSSILKPAEPSRRSITPNPFAHLSDAGATDQSGDEGDDESDEDADEDKAVESSDARSNAGNSKPSSTSQKSLFSRVSKDDKPLFGLNGTPTKPGPSNVFGLGTPTNGGSPFGQSTSTGSNLFGAKPAAAEDHTWKPDSPVKFASTSTTTNSTFGSPSKAGSTQAPSFSFTPTTPEKPKEPGFTSIFQTPVKLGSETTTTPEARPFKGLFGANGSDPSPSLFNKQSTTPAGKPAGFTFGAPPKTDGLAPPSNLSRATTPGTDVTSANESAADTDNDDAAAPDEQTDLTSLTPQEKKDEDLIFEHNKVKLSSFDKEKKAWESKGTGPIRILKNKETSVVRILLRASPSGRVIMNSRLQPTVDYKHAGKNMVQFATFDENGPLTWVAKTGKDEDAAALAAAMQDNKA